jgi:hypothetical protein
MKAFSPIFSELRGYVVMLPVLILHNGESISMFEYGVPYPRYLFTIQSGSGMFPTSPVLSSLKIESASFARSSSQGGQRTRFCGGDV